MRVFGTLKSAQLELWSSDPASAAQVGRVGFHTTTLRPRIANGTLWKDLAFSGGTATNDNHLVLAKAATGTLNALTREQGSLYYDTSANTVKYDDGSALVELATANGQFSLNDGTVSAPSLKFASETDTGLYRVSAGVFGFTVTGTQRLRLTTSGAVVTGSFAATIYTGNVRGDAGTVGAPFFSFSGDDDTGMYSFAADELGFSAGGIRQMEMRGGYIRSMRTHSFVDGNASVPGINFENAQNSGFYRITGTSIGLSLNGVERIDFSVNALVMKPDGSEAGRFAPGQLQLVSGSAGTPSFAWGSDTDTGLYRSGTDQVGITCGGSLAAFVGTAGMAVGSGSSADQIKWKVFSGSVPATSDVTLACPGTVILGCIGIRNNFAPVGYDSDALVYFRDGASANNIRLRNDFGSSQSYTAVMYYQ